MKPNYKYIFGPVPSWRLGSSLGIDLLSQEEKICNFDCVYCQVGRTKRYTINRKTYVSVDDVVAELATLPDMHIDYITFSGRGEPTLAANLGEAIKKIKSIRKEPTAVLTNSALMDKQEVRSELALADFVIAKLDACSKKLLEIVNRPAGSIDLKSIVEGIRIFKQHHQTKLALQMMFTESNKPFVDQFISLVNYIHPEEVQINTPLRSCGVKPLSMQEIARIRELFCSSCDNINVVTVYDERAHKNVISMSDEQTLKRRGKI